MQISQIYVDIWKIQQEFLDISHGHSWQNFSKSSRRNYVVKWILQFLISDYHRAMLSVVFYSHDWEQFAGFGIVHALSQPASNLVFGFDFSATAFVGSKGIANLPIDTIGVRLWKRESETVC